MMATNCLVCNAVVKEELKCSRCPLECHFNCVVGCLINNPKQQKMFQKGKFLCHVCIISRRDDLIITAMQRNQVLHRNNQMDFPLPETFRAKEERRDDGEAAVRVEEPVAAPHPENAGTEERAQDGDGDTGDTDSVDSSDDHAGDGLAPLNETCETKSKKLLSSLNNMITVPRHASTLLIGDSIAHYVDKKEMDQETDNVRVRSVGGLCIPAAVEALKKLHRSYGNFKRVIWSLGTNDQLHQKKHCLVDRLRYIKELEVESMRVFPNAAIHWVVPYAGMRRLRGQYITELVKLAKENAPKIKVHIPPSLRNMVDRGGVHPNDEGKVVLTTFLQKKFYPNKPRAFPKDLGKTRPNTTYAQAHLGHSEPSVNMRPTSLSSGNSRPDQAVWDIADALTCLLSMRKTETSYMPHRPETSYMSHRPWN